MKRIFAIALAAALALSAATPSYAFCSGGSCVCFPIKGGFSIC